LNIRNAADAEAAAQRLSRLSDNLLVEEMVGDGVAEILVGMTVDPQFGQVLVIGAGGVLTELLRDSVTLLPPFTAKSIEAALSRLTISKLFWLASGASPPATFRRWLRPCSPAPGYAEANLNTLLELDINPVIVRPAGLGYRSCGCLDTPGRQRNARLNGAVICQFSSPPKTAVRNNPRRGDLEVTLDRPRPTPSTFPRAAG